MKYKKRSEEYASARTDQSADVSSKQIFGNHTLCAQFLRDYSGLALFADVQPEDIEDVSERYHLFREVEFNSDTVKKVRIRNREEEKHEGAGEWTAAWNLKDRILLGDLFQAYIPDFTYKLVRTREYSNEELLSKEDEISLIMLINKIQRAEDFKEVSKAYNGRMNEIFQRMPVDILDIIISEIRSLCARENLSEQETEEFIKEVEDRKVGYLFENMEKMDIQLERRRTEEAYCMLISSYKKQGMAREDARKQLMTGSSLKEGKINQLLEKFWEK